MMLLATNGSQIFIGGALDAPEFGDMVAADFNGQSWTAIGGATSLGAISSRSEPIVEYRADPSNPDSQVRMHVRKGDRPSPEMEVTADANYSDPGQLALIEGEKSTSTYAFKVQFNDAAAGGQPSKRLFVASIMSLDEHLDEANNVLNISAVLFLDSNLVRINASS